MYSYKVRLSVIKRIDEPLNSPKMSAAYETALEQYNSTYSANKPQITAINKHERFFEIEFQSRKQLSVPVRAIKEYLHFLVDCPPFSELRVGKSNRVFESVDIQPDNATEYTEEAADDFMLQSLVTKALFSEEFSDRHDGFAKALEKLLSENNIR